MTGKTPRIFAELIGDIVLIADGAGDDGWKLEHASARADHLVSMRPQIVQDMKDWLTIEARSGRHSPGANRLLGEVRDYLAKRAAR